MNDKKSRLRTYRIYISMKHRCESPNSTSYERYGERGIYVSPRWLTFDAFLADMGCQPPGMALDRIDNDGPYSPENCRWATRKENARNTRRNHYIEFRGERRCISDWSEITGISKAAILHRIKSGWSVESALTIPANRKTSAQLAPAMKKMGLA